jgi:hypothetical protein
MTLAGLPIGAAEVMIKIDNGGYKIKASAKVGGILSLVSDGRGAATSFGHLDASSDKPQANGYALHTRSSDEDQTVRMALSNGAVSDFAVDPPPAPRRDRIPVTYADRRGVIDPLSALVMPVEGTNGLLSPSACNRVLPVFDGAVRFDIPLSFSRMETVNSTGYVGTAVVCSARYVPIAGHRPNTNPAKFMSQNHDLEVWLAPIQGTHVLAPWRIVVGTMVGRLIISAVSYTSTAALDTQPISARK